MWGKFLKWGGDGLVLRVPKALARRLGATEGASAEMTVENGALVVKVSVTKVRSRYSLAKLVETITEENRHSKFMWAAPRGN